MTARNVLVIGAGLGGLRVAVMLAERGIGTTVLEARDRPGGRILSVAHPLNPGSGVDLGPTWFWPHQRRMLNLARQLGLAVFEQYADGDALYQLAAADVRRVSGAAPPAFRFAGGTARLIDALGARLPAGALRLSARVTRVHREDASWRLTVAGPGGAQNAVQGTDLVIALPPRVALSIEGLGPSLPGALARALRATPTWMAGHAKFVASYDRPFWRDAGLAGDVFSRVGPMAEIHDASSGPDTAPALFGFLGVDARRRAEAGETAVLEACLRQLVDIFGDAASSPAGIAYRDWAQESATTTADDLRGAGVHPHLDLTPHAAELRALRVHFAGTEAAPEEGGYLEGALHAAELAMESIRAS